KGLLDPRQPMGEATGRAMAEWAQGQGNAQAQKATLDEARAEARKGKDALQAFYKGRDDAGKRLVNTIIEELKRLAIEADEAKTAGDEIDFDQSSKEPDGPDDDMTPEQRAEMERAEAEFRSQRSEEQA
ncbi:MAG: hypothetical protein ACPH5G_19075, partial [Pseudooceanicola atlanticus]